MKVQVKASKQTLIVVLIIAIIFTLGSFSLAVYSVGSTYGYIKTTATIDNVEKEVHTAQGTGSNGKSQKIWWVNYHYTVQNNTYNESVRTFLPMLYRNKQTLSVYYDENEPTKVRDGFFIESGILGALFFGIITCFVAKFISIKKKEE